MSKSVLIVDDSRISRMMIKRAIVSIPGIDTIREADCGEKGLNLYKEAKADLVLLDLTMEGGMDGFETLEELKQFDSDAKVFIISADVQKKAQEKILSLGALGFFCKPFNKEQLIQRVNEVLYYEE